MITIKITVDGQEITVGKNAPYKLLSHSGLDNAAFEVSVQASGATDGGYIQSARISSRTVTVSFDIVGNQADALRLALTRLFTPHKQVTLTVTRANVTRKISGVFSMVTVTQGNIYENPTVQLTIMCPNPYFVSIDNFGRNLAEKTAMFYLPAASPVGTTFPISVKAFEERVHLVNDGDVPAGLVAQFIMRGSVTNPLIRNYTTGNAVKVIDSFAQGDVLEVSTITGAKTVTKNGTNIINKTDRSSVFSDFLQVGDNEISYEAESGEGSMDVYIYYSPLYLGV